MINPLGKHSQIRRGFKTVRLSEEVADTGRQACMKCNGFGNASVSVCIMSCIFESYNRVTEKENNDL